MRLAKVVIKGYRSIQGTEILLLDDKVNILIGANDHGKSNILDATSSLNDEIPLEENDKNWNLPDTDSARIDWHFSVDPSELKEQEHKPQDPPNESDDSTNPTEVDLIQKNEENEIIFYKEGIGSAVKIQSVPIDIPKSSEVSLLAMRPRIEIFEPPETNLVDAVTLAELNNDEFEFMQGIFMLAGIWDIREELFVIDDKTSKLLDEASERLTKVLNEQWNQGKDLKWMLRHGGTNGDHIEIRIQDPSVSKRYIRPSLRSSGFQTYFFISMIIKARTHKHKGKFIFLFDEPGTYLHPKAQLDLQRTFERISDNSQIIYTTHSLFLINKNVPSRNKVISKTAEGTKIDQKPFRNNWKSVRDSLGILLSNNFLIADKTLLIEGPSDAIYLYQAIQHFKKQSKLDIDLNDLSIVDTGDNSNYVALAKLMLSEGRLIVALTDGDDSGNLIQSKLEKSCEKEVKDKTLQLHPLPEGKSTEDILVDIKILRKAIIFVAEELVKSEKRKLKEGADTSKLVEQVVITEGTTLGKVIDDTTKLFFEDEDKISKLSIALAYAELSKEEKPNLDDSALKLLSSLSKMLELKGERSVDEGVFEEAK